jgi:hypothetical protein
MSNFNDLDMNQILRGMIDPNTMSLKVLPEMSGDIQIELSAQDGDSVSVRPICGEVLEVAPNQVVDASHARSLFISSVSPMARILVSLDQITWHQLDADKAFLNVDNAAFKFLKVEAAQPVKILMKG